jgi:DNA polymerase III subunit epsilon
VIGRAGRMKTPWRHASWRVVDVETTGLDPRTDEVISFAVVPIEGGRIVSGAHTSGLVRPRRTPSPDSIKMHGLRAADLANAPAPATAAPRFAAALAGGLIVVHYGRIERTFLAPMLAGVGRRYPRHVADTEILGRLWLLGRGIPTPPILPLSRLAGELGLPVHRPHDALGDALTTAQVFLALASHLETDGPENTVTLTRGQQRLAGWRATGFVPLPPAPAATPGTLRLDQGVNHACKGNR